MVGYYRPGVANAPEKYNQSSLSSFSAIFFRPKQVFITPVVVSAKRKRSGLLAAASRRHSERSINGHFLFQVKMALP